MIHVVDTSESNAVGRELKTVKREGTRDQSLGFFFVSNGQEGRLGFDREKGLGKWRKLP